MKVVPVNDVNVCELVFVPDMDVFNNYFNSTTIYQVGGMQ